jgi:hypothetical protein
MLLVAAGICSGFQRRQRGAAMSAIALTLGSATAESWSLTE